MSYRQRTIGPICDTTILKTKRVLLVEEVVLENVISSVKPLLSYTELDEVDGGKTRADKVRTLLDKIQLLVNGSQYEAFNAVIQALAGTQPELFKALCGRAPTVTESDFCIKEVSQAMKTKINDSKHRTDSVQDEEIDLQDEYVELSIVDESAEESELASQGGGLPHEYSLHLDKVQNSDKKISASDILGSEDKPHKKVSLYGRAGIGKSTTMQRWAKQWAQGKWAARFTMLFLLQLRAISTQMIPMTIVELLQLYGLYDFPGHSDSTAFSSWLKNCASKIIILIDGLDEIPGFAERLRNAPHIHDVLQKAHPVDLCINILRGDLLPGCTVISASRPFAGLSQLPADTRAEILGLTTEKVTEFVNHRHPDHVKDIMSVLSKNPILSSVCSITFYCMLITKLLSAGVTIVDTDVETYSRLMAFIVINYCSRKDPHFLLDASSYLSKLSHLAHSGIFELEENKGLAKMVFNEEDFIKSKIKGKDIDDIKKSGIMQFTSRKVGRQESWTAEFFHLSAQELLAVAYFVSHPPYPIHKLDQLFQSGQFNLALQFMFGLHFDRESSDIRRICTAVNTNFHSQAIEPELSSFIDRIVTQNSEDYTASQRLKVCELLHEGQWREKAKEVVSYIAPGRKIEIHGTMMTAIDLRAVAFVCEVEALRSISLVKVHADSTFVDVLLSSLYEHHWETLQELNLERNSIGYSGAAAIAASLHNHDNHILQVLNLACNSISAAGTRSLVKSLRQHKNNTLQVLDLTGNGIGIAGAKAVAQSLCTHNNHTLRSLYLGRNNISAAGAAALAGNLCTLKNQNLGVLILECNGIGDKGAASLATLLDQNTGLQILDISHNQIGYEGAQAIADSLISNTSLRVLDISKQRITHKNVQSWCLGHVGIIALANMLHLNTGLVELDISDNGIGNDGAILIAGAFCNSSTSVDQVQAQVQIPTVAEVVETDVEVRRWTWCGCLPNPRQYSSAEGAGVGLTPYSTTEGAGIDPTQSSALEGAGVDPIQSRALEGAGVDPTQSRALDSKLEGAWIDITPYSSREGAGVDLTQYNTTLRKLVISGNNIAIDGRRALENARKYNAFLNIEI